MDVGVFSRCIKSLIVDHDKVDVPGFGVFYAGNMPASFSDLRTTINPPYRRMYFEKADVAESEGSLLFDHISKELGVSSEQAVVELSWCLGRLRSELDGNRICLLPGLGRMKATSRHDYFFVPDDNLDICPEAFGLKPVCLRRSDSVVDEPATPLPESAPQEAARSETIRETRAVSEKKASDTALVVLRVIIILLIAAIVAAVLLSVLPDEIVDRILYTGEEYRIIHGPVL